jgi:hypothetical protein
METLRASPAGLRSAVSVESFVALFDDAAIHSDDYKKQSRPRRKNHARR